jgi:diguanylate cyclase (GGDEF)-like protein
MAHHDALTGLVNRALLGQRLEQAFASGETFAIHHIDLDKFKSVNDTLGHHAGDVLLKGVSERLRKVVRPCDTIARMGGDEFIVLQTPIEGRNEASALAGRIIKEMNLPFELDGQQTTAGASVGLAIIPGDGATPEQALRNADLALYRAKSDGRGTYRFFEPAMDEQLQSRRALELDLRKALAAGEFELHYQPLVQTGTGEVTGVEALIRWRHPERGLVPPNSFIPLAEEIGLIVPIGEWVIRQACMTASRWPDRLHVAVNISAVQFHHPGLAEVIVSALAASGLDARRLEIEITESVLLHDKEGTLAMLHRLRALGIRIAMDDFGTGYSSLTYLQCFPFDKIKIDRSFIRDIATDPGSLNIVRAIAALANGMGMAATAEGVETQEQLACIAAEGCTEVQGFLFSRPLPAAEIERKFLSAEAPAVSGRFAAA